MEETKNKLDIIVKACEDKKATDINVMNVSKQTSIADYFVIVSGNSSSQTMSIADEIDRKMAEINATEYLKEGYQSGRWILLDYGNIIVHVFHKEEREIYKLEKLWSDIEEDTDKN